MQARRVTTRSLLATATLVSLALAVPGRARADYQLAPGDTIDFAVAGTPDLKQHGPIGVDGTLALPLIGTIKAAGQTLAELRRNVQTDLASRVYRRAGQDGREQPIVVSPDEIMLSIAEYRPVVTTGDVAKPGEQPFRPGMTIRQAVAAAGGYDFVRFRMDNPFLTQADLKSDYEGLWIAFAKGQAELARLKAELDNQPDLPKEGRIETPLERSTQERIDGVQRDALAVGNALHESERRYLSAAVAKEGGRIQVIGEQQVKERQGAEADAQEVARIEGLYSKGAVAFPRVVDARRSMLLSSTRFLQTLTEQARAERERDEMAHKLDQLDATRRAGVLREIADAEVKVETTRAKLTTAAEKLAYAGMLRSQLTNGKGAEPGLVIFRRTGSETARIPATEDADLMPGDVIEVALKQYLPKTASENASDGASTGAHVAR